MQRHTGTGRGAAAAAVALLLSGCAGGNGPSTAAAGGGAGHDRHAAGERPYADIGLGHVHGLGVNPADGVLYVASHTGVHALPDGGEPRRVADRMQDTMGFTVTGPDAFLASGHPDVGTDPHLPPRLGLLRSTDAGETWQSVSLSGQADFHVLQARHDRIYGWDSTSGALLVSEDGGRGWETRSRLALRDLAVSPTDPGVLLATTASGPARSSDGGRTFTPVPGPALVVLTWPADGALHGVDADGTVHTSSDGGRTWTRRGDLPGAPEALGADGEQLFAAVSGGRVLASSDGGRTWTDLWSGD